MSDDDANLPDFGDFGDLPDELRELLGSLGGGDPDELMAAMGQMLPQVQAQMQAMMSAAPPTGPVDWNVARRVAFQVAADGDRDPDPSERERALRALDLAEHWLDAGSLPAPPDLGHGVVVRRGEWVDTALSHLRPLIEPVAAATGRAMAALVPEGGLDDDQLAEAGLSAGLPDGFADLLGGMDMSAMVGRLAASTTGLHAGMAIGNLSQQLLGSHDLGLPTGPRGTAMFVAVNVDEAFAGWDLDAEEVALALALHEAAHRRLFHAVPWLGAHVESLVAQFANGTDLDPARLEALLRDAMMGVDPEDPSSMADAINRAGRFRLEPTEAQQRVLARLQGVTTLTRAWARNEALAAADGRLPSLDAIDEILRRRRNTVGDGEQVLADLLGLQLTAGDPDIGDDFVAAVVAARGGRALHEALAHPENLPDADELAEPSRWLLRMAASDAIPDDATSLFGGLGDAPVEPSAAERLAGEDPVVDLDDAAAGPDQPPEDGSDPGADPDADDDGGSSGTDD
ncbi:zinc-dependent metalloprotease [Salsipaludibacter albus]|uniref:zinc-dependent metalloprotease n=1 Tax=Salsipaludibacter albus TaxID=2849650 RepID=UPI001EE3D888|nr:zinc-dependent metalloprotease [Salsipaludibacter albus]MBY5164328.1 zinc-dependent metalloprotease [Salsipaludibacter albus]